MALGALSVQRQPAEANIAIVSMAGDSSYPTGGSALGLVGVALKDGLAPINGIIAIPPIRPRSGADRIYHWNGGNLLMAFVVSTGAQVANTTDLSADILDVIVVYI